jgi:hypothetical protein
MPMISPALINCRVTPMSKGLGFEGPLGWLCETIKLLAFAQMAYPLHEEASSTRLVG